MNRKTTWGVLLACILLICSNDAAQAATEIKIGTISVQEILAESKAGKEAQKSMEAKIAEYQNKFQKDQQETEALREEIEKKGSVWSEAVRAEKERDYQKKMRELQLKSEDARYELQQLEKQIMEPILKQLHEVIAEMGKKEGFTLIFENTRKGLLSRSGLLYADDKLDISDMVRKELDARTAAATK